MAASATIANLPPPPEEAGREEQQSFNTGSNIADANANNGSLTASASTYTVAASSQAWQADVLHGHCQVCDGEFGPFNRRHHCRLCGQVVCHKCSCQRALIPPSSIVLVPTGGKKALPRSAAGDAADNSISFSPQQDPDRMLTYLSGGPSSQLLYGKGLEERFKLAREPLRVCRGCFQQLAPLQEDLRASNSNAMRYNGVDPTDARRMFNSPVAHTLGHEIRKAAYTLNNLLPLPKRLGAMIGPPVLGAGSAAVPTTTSGNAELDQCKDTCSGVSASLGDLDGVRIPARLLEQAKGLAVLTVFKGGFGLAGVEFGTGLVVARVPSNNNNGGDSGMGQRWSAPSAIGTAGVSWGALVGAQVSDHVFLLMTDDAVRMLFANQGSLQLGADVGVAVGPVGRAVEGNMGAAAGVAAPIYTYSLSKGLYAGVSLDGKVICTRPGVNERFYGRPVTGQEILGGAVPLPPAAQPLYEALARCHVYASGDGSSSTTLTMNVRRQEQERLARMHQSPQHQQLQWHQPMMNNSWSPNATGGGGGVPQHSVAAASPEHSTAGMFANVATPQQQQQQTPTQSDSIVQQSPLPKQPQQWSPQNLMPPDAHSYAGMSDITSDPGY